MRFTMLMLLVFSLSMAANTIHYLDLSTETSCPGDMLHVDAISSDGRPVPEVELRLVLYEPYLGLRALKHTNASGHAFFELPRNGSYRIYIYSPYHVYPQYVQFEYDEPCPPLPPKQMVVELEMSCDLGFMKAAVSDGAEPLEGVFVHSLGWSSMTDDRGIAVLPLGPEDYFIMFERQGYAPGGLVFGYACPDRQHFNPQ